jgi:hypothetical protein
MREFLERCTLVCGVAMWIFVTNAAAAEELLIMPFACQASGGSVNLSPAPSQSYRIYGKPEHQVFTACSPIRPEFCRDWVVHRFDLDCGGVRVSWLSVVNALTQWRPTRAFVSDGRLHMRMGPWWNGEARRPCAGPRFGLGPRTFGRAGSGWPCERTLASSQPAIIDMPIGFAPTLGIYARFVSIPEALAPAKTQSGDSTVSSATSRSSLTDQIVPNVEGPPVVQAELPLIIAQAGGQAESTTSISQKPQHAIAKASEGTKTLRQAPTEPVRVDTIPADTFGFGLVAILLLFSAIWFATTHRAAPVDAVAVSGRPTRPSAPLANPSRSRSSAAWGAPIEDSEWLPSNRSEAFEVLGAGPDTAEHILKKIVKNLRQNWHPDLASRDEERRIRGLKLKQINVAWDIICGKRTSA